MAGLGAGRAGPAPPHRASASGAGRGLLVGVIVEDVVSGIVDHRPVIFVDAVGRLLTEDVLGITIG